MMAELAASKDGNPKKKERGEDTIPGEITKDAEFDVYLARGFDGLKVKIGKEKVGAKLAQHLWDCADDPGAGGVPGRTRSSSRPPSAKGRYACSGGRRITARRNRVTS